MSLVINLTLADTGLSAVVCAAGGESQIVQSGQDVTIYLEAGTLREFLITAWKGTKLVEEVRVTGAEIVSGGSKDGRKVAVRWHIDGADTSRPAVPVTPDDLRRSQLPPLTYNGACTLTISARQVTHASLTTPGPLRCTKPFSHDTATFNFPLLTPEDIVLLELPPPTPTLLIKVDQSRGKKTYSLKNKIWKAAPVADGDINIEVTTDVTMGAPVKVDQNCVQLIQGRFPTTGRWSVSGHEAEGEWPCWGGGAKLTGISPGGELQITKDGKPYGKIPIPHGKGAGWFGPSDGRSPRGWPEYELYLIYNFPEDQGTAETFDLEIRAVRSRKLRAADGEPPQAVACGIVCLDQIHRLDATTPTDGVWTWASGVSVKSISMKEVPFKVAVTMLEDVEGVPLGTGYFEVTEKKVADAGGGDLRLALELADEKGDPAGSAEVVVKVVKKPQAGRGKGVKKKPAVQGIGQKKTGGKKGTVLVSIQQMRGADPTPTSAVVKIGTRIPEVKPLSVPSHTIFNLSRLRELLNIKFPHPYGQISFVIEPLIADGTFKSTSGEGWVYLQPNPGPYHDHLANTNQGEAYIRWTLDVKQNAYYELPTGRDLEHHLKWSQIVQRKPVGGVPTRQVKRAVPKTTLPPMTVNLKVKQVRLNEGGLGVDFKIVEMGGNKNIPVGTKVKLVVKSDSLVLSVSCGGQAVGVCTVPLTAPCQDRYPLTRYGAQVGDVLLRWDKPTGPKGTVLQEPPPQEAPTTEYESAPYIPPPPDRMEDVVDAYEYGDLPAATGAEQLDFALMEEREKRQTAEQNEVYYKAAAEEAEGRARKLEERNASLQTELKIVQDRYRDAMVGTGQYEAEDLKQEIRELQMELNGARGMRYSEKDMDVARIEVRNMAAALKEKERELNAVRAMRYTEKDMDVARMEVRNMAATLKEQERELASLRTLRYTERDMEAAQRTIRELERDLKDMDMVRIEARDMSVTLKEQDRQLASLRATNSALETTVRDLKQAASSTPHVSRDAFHATLHQAAVLERDLQEARHREEALLSYIDTLRSDLASSSALLKEVARQLP